MFEDLKNLVNTQNMHKIKTNQRYLNHENSILSQDSNALSLQDQIHQRMNIFRILTDSNTQNTLHLQREYQRQQVKKYRNEKELLEEKIRINQELHQRQLEYESQKYQREINTLKSQIEKYEFAIKKHHKQQGLIVSLKKENRQILQLHQQDKQIIERLNRQLVMLRRQNLQLKTIIRKKQEEQSELKANKYIESQSQVKLKQQIAILQQEKITDRERKKQLESTIGKLRALNEDLQRQIDIKKHQFDSQICQMKQKCRKEVERLEEDNMELKKRNQLIEDSFIGHLTQTSLNLQQNLKVLPQRTLRNNSSLDLQDSPIRAKSKGRERSMTLIEEDPQKAIQNCNCSSKINKLRSKLQQANAKIVQLLKQKCNKRVIHAK